ncbi:MAG: hypothetical protein ACO3C0_12515, partial [Burkholderiaceae bacterium]
TAGTAAAIAIARSDFFMSHSPKFLNHRQVAEQLPGLLVAGTPAPDRSEVGLIVYQRLRTSKPLGRKPPVYERFCCK